MDQEPDQVPDIQLPDYKYERLHNEHAFRILIIDPFCEPRKKRITKKAQCERSVSATRSGSASRTVSASRVASATRSTSATRARFVRRSSSVGAPISRSKGPRRNRIAPSKRGRQLRKTAGLRKVGGPRGVSRVTSSSAPRPANTRTSAETTKPLHVRNPAKPVRGPLMCEFKTSSLLKPDPYEALSYVWGDGEAPKTKSVRVWDKDRLLAKKIMITDNLYVALRQLRDKVKPRRLWVDALCIDQKSIDEKPEQLKKMDQIYAKATNVCVFLGKGANESDCVPTFVKKIINLEELDDLVSNQDTVKKWGALSALMRREWFSRRWCIQEIALAKKAVIHCGSKKMDWEDFADAVLLFVERSEDVIRLLTRHDKQKVESKMFDQIEVKAPGAQSLVETLSHLIRKSPNGIERLASIDTLVSTLSSYDVTVPRDAIFALIKLAKDSFNSTDDLIKIQSDKSTLETYVDFIKFVIKRSKSLDIICMPWAPVPKDENNFLLPSWIVPISRRAFDQPRHTVEPNNPGGKLGEPDNPTGYFSRVNADSLVSQEGRKRYSAAGDIPMKEWEILEDPLRLVVRGRKVGEIVQLELPATKGNIPFSWLDRANRTVNGLASVPIVVDSDSEKEPEQDPMKPKTRRRTGPGAVPNVPEAFWRTLVADRGPRGTNPPGWYRRTCQKSFTRPIEEQDRRRGRRGHVYTDEEIHLAMINSKGRINRPALQFLRRVQATTWNRRFMVTRGKRFGIAPPNAEIGDLLCLLWGCSVPVVLRKRGEYFELIGDCYIHDIMNGEHLERNRGLGDQTDHRDIKFEIL